MSFYNEIVKEDFYKLIGVDKSSNDEQILVEYKLKVIKCHPDKNKSPSAVNQFQKLQYAKCVLTNPELRAQHDSWLDSGLNISFEEWKFYKSKIGPMMHWGVKKSPDLMICRDSKTTEDEFLQAWRSGNTYDSETVRQFRNYGI